MAGCQVKVEKKETLETGGWFGSLIKKSIFFKIVDLGPAGKALIFQIVPCRSLIVYLLCNRFPFPQQNEGHTAISGRYVICCGGCWLLIKAPTINNPVVPNANIIRAVGVAAILFWALRSICHP